MKPLIQLSIFNLSEDLKNALKRILDDVELEKLKLEKELREIKHVNLNLKIENEELKKINDEFYPDPEGPYFVYPDHDHPNRPQKVNDFIFISMKSDDPNSYEPDKILHPFMNMIAIDEACANEIIAYLDETEYPEEALCSNLKDNTSSSQGKGFLGCANVGGKC